MAKKDPDDPKILKFLIKEFICPRKNDDEETFESHPVKTKSFLLPRREFLYKKHLYYFRVHITLLLIKKYISDPFWYSSTNYLERMREKEVIKLDEK